MAAGVGRCCCRLPPSSLALKGSSWSGADTEVGSDDKRYSQSIRCREAVRPLLCTILSQFVYLFLSRSVWASHPAGSGDVGAHSWEQFGR